MQNTKFLYTIGYEVYTIQVQVKNIRHLYLRVIGDHLIQINCHHFVEKEQILHFIQAKELWIRQHSNISQKVRKTRIQDGYLTIFGQKRLVTLKRGEVRNITPIKDGYVVTIPELTQKEFDQVVQPFYRFRVLNEAMTVRATYDEKIRRAGVDRNPLLYVSKMKSRWGSFSARTNRIHLNQQLIFYPKLALEAVLAHEFAHVLVRNHGLKFYQVLLSWLPDYKERLKLLKKESYDLECNDLI